MKIDIKDPVVIFYDNTSAINILKNLVKHTKTKYITMKYHFLRELVQYKEVRLEYINKKEKYVATIVNCSNIVWFKQLMSRIKIEMKDLVIIYCDNTSAINISKNPVMHSKTKHISIKYHFLRESV